MFGFGAGRLFVDWQAIVRRVVFAIRRRPFRVVEVVVAVAALLGVAIDPDAQEHLVALVVLLVGGGEVAQRYTTPLADPHNGEEPLLPLSEVAARLVRATAEASAGHFCTVRFVNESWVARCSCGDASPPMPDEKAASAWRDAHLSYAEES